MGSTVKSFIAYLLLRDGHAVPVAGISPDEIKAAAKAAIKLDDVKLSRVQGINAVLHCLGFDGDISDYRDQHWPGIQALMGEHGLNEYKNLFDIGPAEMTFELMAKRRRALADRIFFGPAPTPRRAFTGYGYDWSPWSDLYGTPTFGWQSSDVHFEPNGVDDARQFVYQRRAALYGNVAFFSDHLLDLDGQWQFETATYFERGYSEERQQADRTHHRKVAEMLRYVLDQGTAGWVEIIRATPNLVFLKGPDGAYDLLWRDLRDEAPPTTAPQERPFGLDAVDTPSSLKSRVDFGTWNYYRKGAWAEKESHEAEKHHYATGGRMLPYHPGSTAVLENYLRSKRVYDANPKVPAGVLDPTGLHRVQLAGGKLLLVSDLVTVSEFRQFGEQGYFDRRVGEDWAAANEGNAPAAPVGATLRDALAFCAWKERALGVPVRLIGLTEHRQLRPFASEHYKDLSQMDFPWERFPPRLGLQSAVVWSEARFLEPGPDVPEFPDPNGLSSKSRKRWIAEENWPPKAVWRDPLPWAAYAGLQFVDAWDAYEWCKEGYAAGRYWEGPLGGEKSWGEYKNVKICFRLVIDLGDAGGKGGAQ